MPFAYASNHGCKRYLSLNNIVQRRFVMKIFMGACLLLFSLGGLANENNGFDPAKLEWRLYMKKDGITIYQADRHPETGLIPLKANTVLNHPVAKVLTVLNDRRRRVEWVPRLLESYTVEGLGTDNRIDYARYHAPWPFQQRTFVIRTHHKYNPATKGVVSTIESVEHPSIPLREDRTRAHSYKGTFLVRPLEGGQKSFAEISLLTDFKGYLPVWLVNIIQKKWPLRMFRGLRNHLDRDDVKVIPKFLPTALRK